MAKSSVDPGEAFQLYVEMGDARSINGLFNTLKSRGFRIGRETLNTWARENEWQKRIPEVLAARELEREAVELKHQAAKVLEEAGAKPAEELGPIRSINVTDFAQTETTQAASERVNGLVSAMAQVCMDHVGKQTEYLEVPQLVMLVNATRDLAKAAGDLHRALNPPAPKLSRAEAAADAKVIEAQAAPPGKAPMIPDDAEELIESLLNPPRLSGKL